MSEAATPGEADAPYPCVGICMTDADEAHCLGCGRPWGEPVVPVPASPPAAAPSPPNDGDAAQAA